MRVLITGGAGYIGSVLAEMLVDNGYKVTVLDRLFFGKESLAAIEDRIKIMKDDVRWFDPKILSGVDAVIDMAALSNDPSGELDPKKTLDINFKGRVRVAKLAKKYGVSRYMLASSCSVYGFQNKIIDESSKTRPLTTYAKANVLWENSTLPLSSKNFCVTAMRQATVYGLSKRMRFDLSINGMVLNFFRDGKVKIMRNGDQWRPFVHVRDTSTAFMKLLEADTELINKQKFNVGSNEQNFKVFEMAKAIAKKLSLDFNYEWYGSIDNRSYKVDFSKIRKTIGYKTKFGLGDGAKEIHKALKENKVIADERTITVKWYKHLLSMQKELKEIEMNGKIL